MTPLQRAMDTLDAELRLASVRGDDLAPVASQLAFWTEQVRECRERRLQTDRCKQCGRRLEADRTCRIGCAA
jgi:hypothetical protein